MIRLGYLYAGRFSLPTEVADLTWQKFWPDGQRPPWEFTQRSPGMTINPDPRERLSREEALRLYTHGSAWFSSDDEHKGRLAVGQVADFATLSADYFAIPEDEIRGLESVLTVLGGRVVHGSGQFKGLDPELPAPSPSWSPTARFSGYDNSQPAPHDHSHPRVMGADGRLWESGCGCWF